MIDNKKEYQRSFNVVIFIHFYRAMFIKKSGNNECKRIFVLRVTIH